MGKITINFSEDFENIDAAFEHVAKLKTVMSLPFELLRQFAAAGVASAATNPAAPAMTAAQPVQNAPTPRAPIQESSAAPLVATNTVGAVNVGGSVSRAAEPVNSPVPIPAKQASEAGASGEGSRASAETASEADPVPQAPADTKPRGRRGRPPREVPAATEAAAQPSTPEPAAVNAAISAGIADADESKTFMEAIRSHIETHGPTHYLPILASCKDADGKPCRSSHQVPPEKRAKFLEKLAEAVAAKAAA